MPAVCAVSSIPSGGTAMTAGRGLGWTVTQPAPAAPSAGTSRTRRASAETRRRRPARPRERWAAGRRVSGGAEGVDRREVRSRRPSGRGSPLRSCPASASGSGPPGHERARARRARRAAAGRSPRGRVRHPSAARSSTARPPTATARTHDDPAPDPHPPADLRRHEDDSDDPDVLVAAAVGSPKTEALSPVSAQKPSKTVRAIRTCGTLPPGCGAASRRERPRAPAGGGPSRAS